MVRRDALNVLGAASIVCAAAVFAIPPPILGPAATGIVAGQPGTVVLGRTKVMADPGGRREVVDTVRVGSPRIVIDSPLGPIQTEVAPFSAWPPPIGVAWHGRDPWREVPTPPGFPEISGGYAVHARQLVGGDPIVLLAGDPPRPVRGTPASILAGDRRARGIGSGVLALHGVLLVLLARKRP